MPFFEYYDELFNADLRYGNEELEIEKSIVASEANAISYMGTHYIEQRGYTTIEAKILLNIRVHKLIKYLINLLITIDESKNINPNKNLRLKKLNDSLLVASLDSLFLINRFQKNMVSITDYKDGTIYNVHDFFEKNIDFCVLFLYREDFNALIGYNQVTTELGALMGVYEMLFGDDLLKLNKKYNTKYVFEMLKIVI